MKKLTYNGLFRVCLILSPIASVWLLGERLVTAWDPANFCLTLRYGFDMSQNRPHPPGYPLLAGLWNIPYQLLPIEPFTALRITNCLFMILAVAMIGKAYQLLWGKNGSLAAMLLLATSPVFLYYGGTGEMYVFDAFISLLVFNVFFSASRNRLPLYAFLFGFAGGFRQSSVIFLIPLVIVILWSRRMELRLKMSTVCILAGLFAVGFASWFIPLVGSVGGFENYWKLFTDIIDVRATSLQNIVTIATVAAWLLIGSVGFIIRKPGILAAPVKKYLLLFLAWLIPPLLFFIFRHYSKGYILIFAPMILLCIARWIEIFYPKNALRIGTSIAAIQLALFLFFPFIQADSLPPREKRTAAEHITSGLYRMVSGLASTESHIRASEDEMKEAIRLINLIHTDSVMIIIDPSAYRDIARCMQVFIPKFTYATFQPWDTMHFEIFSGKYETIENAQNIFYTASDLYVISNPNSVQDYQNGCGVQPLAIGKYIAIYPVSHEKREQFNKYFHEKYFY